MLPFPNRKGRHDEVLELEDEDLVLVEASPLAPEAIASIRETVSRSSDIEAEPASSSAFPLSEIEVVFTPIEIAQPSPPESVVVPIARAADGRAFESTRPSAPRLVWDADAENDVADECLASIAVETSKTRLSDPFLFAAVPPPARRERKDLSPVIPPPAPSSSIVGLKIPKASPPPVKASPFERQGDKAIWARKSGTNEVDDRKSLPSVFTRKTPFQPIPVASVREASPHSSMPPPVTMPSEHPKNEHPKNEPTVILLRERPRGVWVFGSAAIGALCAVTAMHLLSPLASHESPPPPTVVALPAPPPPPTTVVPPPPPATTAAEAKPIPTVTLKPSQPAVVSFSDDQGVAIAKPKPKPVAATAKPPMVPDTTAKVAEPPPPAPPKPKRPLTPAQELSEAQLKASLMK